MKFTCEICGKAVPAGEVVGHADVHLKLTNTAHASLDNMTDEERKFVMSKYFMCCGAKRTVMSAGYCPKCSR